MLLCSLNGGSLNLRTVPSILNIFRKRKETQSEQIVMKDSSGQASNIDIFKALKSVEQYVYMLLNKMLNATFETTKKNN